MDGSADDALQAATGYDGAQVLTSYDNAGQTVHTTQDAQGQSISYRYDAAGQLTGISEVVAGPNAVVGSTKTTTYGYDSAGNRGREITTQDGQTYEGNNFYLAHSKPK